MINTQGFNDDYRTILKIEITNFILLYIGFQGFSEKVS